RMNRIYIHEHRGPAAPHPHAPRGTMEHMADDNRLVNTPQFEAWNGYEGRHWAEHQARYDALNDPANAPLLAAARLRDTDDGLDIGCGNGRLTRLAARTARRTVGVDLSTPMLERARASASGEHLTNVT